MTPLSDVDEFQLLLGTQQRARTETATAREHTMNPGGQPDSGHSHASEPQREWLDRLGILLSVVCGVHCALTPILVAVAPFFFTAEFEFRTKAVLLTLAGVALGWGFVSHRSWKPLLWLAVGLGAFGLAEWMGHDEVWEIVATVFASGALIMAHLTNARACRVAAGHEHSLFARRG